MGKIRGANSTDRVCLSTASGSLAGAAAWAEPSRRHATWKRAGRSQGTGTVRGSVKERPPSRAFKDFIVPELQR